MGLDMYWWASRTATEKAQALLKDEPIETLHEIGYFRKFHDLNEYILKLYSSDIDILASLSLRIGDPELEAMRRFLESYDFRQLPSGAAEMAPKHLKRICDSVATSLQEGRQVTYRASW